MLTSHFILLIFVILFLLKIVLYVFVDHRLKESMIIEKDGNSIESIRQRWLNKTPNNECVDCEKCKHEVLFILSELDDTIRIKEKLAKYCISKLQSEGNNNVQSTSSWGNNNKKR